MLIVDFTIEFFLSDAPVADAPLPARSVIPTERLRYPTDVSRVSTAECRTVALI